MTAVWMDGWMDMTAASRPVNRVLLHGEKLLRVVAKLAYIVDLRPFADFMFPRTYCIYLTKTLVKKRWERCTVHVGLNDFGIAYTRHSVSGHLAVRV